MAVVARCLIDTSAAARMADPRVRERLAPLISAGVVATTAQLDAEALYSARTPDEYGQVWDDRRLAYEYLPTDDEHWRQALEVQRKLARTGRHRAVGMADLLIAVHAALNGLVLVHYDADFEIAAEFLDFQQRWVVERGSI